jgi:hypothetical protein
VLPVLLFGYPGEQLALVGGGPLPFTVIPQLVDAPAASWPLYDAAAAVTVRPDCVAVAFHALATVSEPGSVSAVVHVEVAVVPVFATLTET